MKEVFGRAIAERVEIAWERVWRVGLISEVFVDLILSERMEFVRR